MIKLKCLEAYTRDVGRGVIRIDYDTMDQLNVSTGDYVEVKGKRKTVAKCLPLYSSDEDKQICRIDGLERNNADTVVNESIKIKNIIVAPAEKINVIALEAVPPIDERYITEALENMGVVVGDNIMIPYFGGRLTFKVSSVEPKGAVVITQKTLFNIIEEEEADKVTCPTCGSLV